MDYALLGVQETGKERFCSAAAAALPIRFGGPQGFQAIGQRRP
jgi:hypothetical protein